ncbi:mandelate dehydrogenase [Chelativorans sp. ZYF759]|uniref:alpha-hydroxy-acid oxidizing protein n=1 Tax=Chelativorans sp. ZYF759 TaxID=2692213 RepID=UPI00145F7635|nr:alpha-hydroxy-acid oxidizing protein [Chelativorans sp. ZYF759]NMG39495.1 mandelate dehydrogenase [Chelativorans sp. ZYF759]
MSGPASVEDYRKLAKRRLPRAVFDYIDGGAGDERGVARNRDAMHKVLFDPRVLVDVSTRDISVPFFDTRLPMPFIVGPTGLNGAARPGGDAMLARAAARAGIPFVLSTAATTSIEDIARATDGEWWFQLYVMERDFAAELCRRALAAGCRTLVLTVDCQIGGRRERDTRNGFVVPFRMNPRFFAGCAIRPHWALSQMRNGVPKFGNMAIDNAGDAASQAVLMQRKLDTSFDWEDLERLRQDWPHRLIVKGVMRADDAARCYALGVDGVVISNHGGRQLEDMPAPIEILPEVVVPKGRMLMVDGGFRSGSDVVKALALGAHAVMLGRATLFGMAAAGEAGASAVIELIRQDIERTLGLIGCPRAEDLSAEFLRPA